MKTLNIFKDTKVLKDNWYVIVATVILIVSSEVFCGIMDYERICSDGGMFRFFGNIILRFTFLIAGTLLAYFFGAILNTDIAGISAGLFTILTVLSSDSVLGYMFIRNYNCYSISIVLAMISLAFYYLHNCTDSLLHTLLYFLMNTVLAVVTAGEIEFFIVLFVVVFMFTSKWMLIKSDSARIVNYICITIAVIALICMLVEKMFNYLSISYIEGTVYHPESILLSAEMFGKSGFYEEFADAPSVYILTKIFGYYGRLTGTAMCVIIGLFVACIFMKCVNCSGFVKPADLVTSMVMGIRCIAGFFQNFSVISGYEIRIPILSEGIWGHLITGILLGYIFASRQRLFGMQDAVSSFFSKSTEKNSDD